METEINIKYFVSKIQDVIKGVEKLSWFSVDRTKCSTEKDLQTQVKKEHINNINVKRY